MDTKKRIKRSAFNRYGIAVLVSVVAIALKLSLHLLNPQWNLWLNPVALPLIFLAITISSVHGGRGPGLLSALLCSACDLYFFVPPIFSFDIYTVSDGIEFGIFTLAALLISSITSSLYEAREKAYIASEKALDFANQKANFVANVTHEIRTPLNAIIGLTGLLSDSRKIGKEEKRYVKKIQDSSETLLVLINDILDFSKMDFAKIRLEVSDFNFIERMNETLELVSEMAKKKGLSLSSSMDQSIPGFLKGDSARLAQILVNLLGNAIKFTDAGSVRLRIKRVREDISHVVLRFEVADTGTGVAKENKEKIFEAFFQGDLAIARKYGGTGLGLSISRKLVTLMGGTIGVESEPGIGSTFWFELPFGRSDVVSVVDKLDPTKKGTLPRVLVVDDNEVNQLVAVKLLEKFGFLADSVNNGKEAVTLLEKVSYDAILMDCHMPEMDGYAATRKIREDEVFSGMRVPIIAMTAYTSKENEDLCKEVGMDDYISKPIQVDDLLAVLKKWTTKATLPLRILPPALEPRTHGQNLTLDVERLMTLRDQLNGEGSTLNTLIDAFLSHTPTRIKSLEELAAAMDFKSLSRIAYGLRTASATMGAVNMARLCQVLERLSETQAAKEAVLATMHALSFEFLQAKEKLNEFKTALI